MKNQKLKIQLDLLLPFQFDDNIFLLLKVLFEEQSNFDRELFHIHLILCKMLDSFQELGLLCRLVVALDN
jgi:hypothetical protein